MSKIICDVCGTAYPETAAVCPICGCAKNTTTPTAAAETVEEGEGAGYNYVKGGRFSKKNVRKRNKGKDFTRTEEPEEGQEGTSRALIIVVVALLLAIAAVLVYIGVRFIFPGDNDKPTDPPAQTTTQPSVTETTAPQNIPCTELKLSSSTIELPEADTVWLLSAEPKPANTTDKITFQSSDEKVVTVSDTGTITAVGGGEAVITVTCGDVTAECKVKCNFDAITEPTTQPTEPPVEVPAGFVLKLNRKDFTLSKEGESWTLYKETDGVKASDITWTTADPKVATVEDGKVVGVNYGDTTITATIGDQTASCIVRIRFRATNTGDNEGSEGGETTAPAVKISHTDVTLQIGETFMLTLTNADGAKIQVEWTASEEGFVTIDGSRITGQACGENDKVKTITVSTTYEEQTYSCIVRVAPKKEAE